MVLQEESLSPNPFHFLSLELVGALLFCCGPALPHMVPWYSHC